jgi:undecaprenyl-diphosphatase
MNFLQAILLGLIQGITEFLPISSSGHLFIVQEFLAINDNSLSFEIALHSATLLAVIVYFWSEIKTLSKKTLLNIFLASIPLIPVVFLTHHWVDRFSHSTIIIGILLLLTAVFNYLSFLTLKNKEKEKQIEKLESIKATSALKIGILQTVAILPGISRSGITLYAALTNNIKDKIAFQFVFLLSIPAIIGAIIFDIIQSNGQSLQSTNWSLTLPAMFIAFLSGIYSLKILKKVLSHNRFLFFAAYCLILGSTLLLIS